MTVAGRKKGTGNDKNKLLLLAFIQKTDKKKYNDIVKLPTKKNK